MILILKSRAFGQQLRQSDGTYFSFRSSGNFLDLSNDQLLNHHSEHAEINNIDENLIVSLMKLFSS